MGFPDYFNKNAQAASRLLDGLKADAFKAVLEREIVGIAIDTTTAGSKEGNAIFDLVVRLVGRLYPKVLFFPLDEHARSLLATGTAMMNAINPNVTIEKDPATVTKWLVLGNTRLPRLPRVRGKFVMYVGSENWIAKLSTKTPQGVGSSHNPFGAGVAACLAVANLFRSVFADQLPGAKLDADLQFSVLDLTKIESKRKNPAFKAVDLGKFYLVGLGAIGNGFLWALGRANCKGNLHAVDAEQVDATNLQRYVMTDVMDIDAVKVELGKKWLADTDIKVETHAVIWEEVASASTDWRFERVAVAVDTERDRIRIQASLPKITFNSWTSSGELGLSRHRFDGKEACLACLYMPTKKTLNLDQIIARALHLSEDPQTLLDLRTRLELGLVNDQAFLERVSTGSNVPIDQLLPFVGKSLREFYVKAVCGGMVIGFVGAAGPEQADVPMAFQSALAGILLAADVVADVAGLRKNLDTITQLNLLNAVPSILSRGRHKQPDGRCICSDEDFISAYRAKYSSTL